LLISSPVYSPIFIFIFFLLLPRPPLSTLFPYTTLFRSAVVLAALLPSLAYAQNTQFSDCRTLEAADHNVGPDEALVDGMVCKVVKPKASSWVSSPPSGKTAQTENRMALLGIIEPETLRSKVKVEVKATGVVRTPSSGKTAQTENRMA